MKIEFDDIETGEYSRFTKAGPIYQKDNEVGAQCLTGRRAGCVNGYVNFKKAVYPIKVKIVEVK